MREKASFLEAELRAQLDDARRFLADERAARRAAEAGLAETGAQLRQRLDAAQRDLAAVRQAASLKDARIAALEDACRQREVCVFCSCGMSARMLGLRSRRVTVLTAGCVGHGGGDVAGQRPGAPQPSGAPGRPRHILCPSPCCCCGTCSACCCTCSSSTSITASRR